MVLRNVLRRPLRSSLTVAGLAVAVCAVVALVGFARGYEDSIRQSYRQRRVDLMVLRAGSVQKFSSVLDERLAAAIRQLPGVREVSPVLVDVVSFDEHDLIGVPLLGITPRSGVLSDVRLLAGCALGETAGGKPPRQVMLGRALAPALGASVGQTVELLEGEPFEVVGIFESTDLAENGAAMIPLAELQRLLDRQGRVTYFLVGCERNDRASIEPIARRIEALAPGLAALPAGQYVDSAVEVRMAQATAWLTSTIALGIGAIGMVNTMMTSVFERTREIAVLRALGWRRRRVVRMVLMESAAMALLGALLGTAAALLLVASVAALPGAASMVPRRISPDVIAQGFAVALGVALIGGIYPAWRAARLMPTEGLRHE